MIFLHVAIGRMQQPSRLGRRQYAHRIRGALGAQIGAFQRIHCNIDTGILHSIGSLRAHRLPDIQHGSFVALALSNYDISRHMDGFERLPHGVDCRLIGRFGVTLSHGAGGCDRRRFDHMDKIAQQVAFNADRQSGKSGGAHKVAVPILTNYRFCFFEGVSVALRPGSVVRTGGI